MNFIVTVLAHEPITAFTPLHLIAWITRIACAPFYLSCSPL